MWSISTDGTLLIAGGVGVDVEGTPPWASRADDITSVEITGDVTAPAKCQGLFSGLKNLQSADLSKLDMSAVETTEAMFFGCTSLTSLDLSGWNMSKVTDMGVMFQDCTSLTSLNLSGWDTSNVTDMRNMFDGCAAFETLDLSGTGWNTSNVTNAPYMFDGCNNLSSIKVGPAYAINSPDMFPEGTAFGNWWSADEAACFTNEGIKARHPREGVTTYTSYIAKGNYGDCPWEIDPTGTLVIHEGNMESIIYPAPWYEWRDKIVVIVIDGTVTAPPDCTGLFQDLSNLRSAYLDGLNVSSTYSTSDMFSGCSKIGSLDLSKWNFSPQNVSSMFEGCASLEELDVSGMNTGPTSTNQNMFKGCDKLASFTVGANYAIHNEDMFPRLGETWRSMGTGVTYGSFIELKASDRHPGYADTYTCASEVAPSFKTCSLVLDDMVGVTFYCDLTMLDDDQKKGTYMVFELDGDSQTVWCDLNHTDPTKHTYHGFTCPVRSVQMADEITATLHAEGSGGGTISTTYSVKDYVDYVWEHPQAFSQATRDLVGAIADYGHYMQPFLSKSAGWNIGDGKYNLMPAHGEIGTKEVAAAKSAVTDDRRIKVPSVVPSSVNQLTYSLALDAKTSIYLYVKPVDGFTGEVSATVTNVANSTIPAGMKRLSDGRYRIAIEGISANELGNDFEVTITLGEETFPVKVSPLSYVYDVLNSTSGDFSESEAQNAVTSLYRYYQKTMAYRASISGQNG